MCVYIYIYIYVHVHVYMCIHIHKHIYTHMRADAHAHAYIICMIRDFSILSHPSVFLSTHSFHQITKYFGAPGVG